AFSTAKSEAKACFGDDSMYIEKLVINPKHIEFQILADNAGNIIHLGERDCSIQRKNQKLLEESPSKALTKEKRSEMGAVAVKAARAAKYTGAGTVEFILDNDKYYFIEMNTRIQVEHPVTEMLTGTDLIRDQIRIAAGLALDYKQEDIKFSGHAIECRINAENPSHDFMPSSGKINFVHFPGGNGTRVDSAIYSGYETSPFFDSMLAKIIVLAPTRLEAIRKMRRALEEMVVEGIDTNIELQHLIMFDPDFVKGSYNTGFIEKNLESLLKVTATFDK
ncbi:MAG: acetyl-CoA carboxylase biotin carboxylase subunit, partial [Oscillospiraceae bacterium]